MNHSYGAQIGKAYDAVGVENPAPQRVLQFSNAEYRKENLVAAGANDRIPTNSRKGVFCRRREDESGDKSDGLIVRVSYSLHHP